jgi:hypothetical protein
MPKTKVPQAKLTNALKGLKKPGASAVPVASAIKPPPKDPELPVSDAKTLTPKYLLGHQNHFDPNTYTPEGVLRDKRGAVSSDTTPTTT